MELKSLLYVSRNLVRPDETDAEVADIVAVARRRNAAAAVTGALIHTDVRFAQILEGPPEAVDEIMHSILRDPRHEQVTVIAEGPIVMRRFADWSLSYSGPSLYVGRHIKPLLNSMTGAAERARLGERLVYLMQELARADAA